MNDSTIWTSVKGKTEEIMRISCQLLAIGILYLMPLASTPQDVVPYAVTDEHHRVRFSASTFFIRKAAFPAHFHQFP
jgi:hypothetical protein